LIGSALQEPLVDGKGQCWQAQALVRVLLHVSEPTWILLLRRQVQEEYGKGNHRLVDVGYDDTRSI
jgi:hypothetical protein